MGWQVVLVERAAGLREEGYLIDFFGPGFDVAESIGLLPRLREKAYTVTEVNYVDQFGRPRAALKTSRRPPHLRMVPARLPNPTTAPSPRPAGQCAYPDSTVC